MGGLKSMIRLPGGGGRTVLARARLARRWPRARPRPCGREFRMHECVRYEGQAGTPILLRWEKPQALKGRRRVAYATQRHEQTGKVPVPRRPPGRLSDARGARKT